jgi:hypothetical protein
MVFIVAQFAKVWPHWLERTFALQVLNQVRKLILYPWRQAFNPFEYTLAEQDFVHAVR